MDNIRQIINEEAMDQLAQEIGGSLKAGDILLLKGDLGAGKTTFTKYLARYLGVKDTVSSPTFTVIAEYVVSDNPNIKEMVHVDLYRFETLDKEMRLSLQELWDEAQNRGLIMVIEWSERLGTITPKDAITLEFSHGDTPGLRIVKILG